MDDFFLNVINKPVEEQALAGKKELWAQAPIIQQAKGRNEILKLAKFMSTINNEDVNAEMQEFYKAAQRFTQDPAGEDQAKLKLTLDSAVTVLVKGNFEVEETCRKFLACDGKLAVSILPESMPATAEPKKPPLNPLVGGFPDREQFIKKHLRPEVSSKRSYLSWRFVRAAQSAP